MTIDDEEERLAQEQRRALIREALAAGGPVVARLHPHLHAPGYAVYVEHGTARIYACTLVSEVLPVVFDGDFVTMEAATDPEETVRAWLSREFPGASLANVRVERYVDTGRRLRRTTQEDPP